MYYYEIDPNASSYMDFTQNSVFWAQLQDRYWSDRTLPKYCWICFSFRNIQLHHENYEVLGHELKGNNLKLFLLKKYIVPVCRDCHKLLTFDETGEKIPLSFPALRERRIQLRKQYVRKYLKFSTTWPFFKQWIYRLIW